MKSKNEKQSKKSKNTWVKIDWKDHFSQPYEQGWSKAPDLEPVVVTSVGVVYAENKEVVSLAQNVSSEGHYGNTMNILKSCIVKRVKL